MVNIGTANISIINILTLYVKIVQSFLAVFYPFFISFWIFYIFNPFSDIF